MHFTGSRLRITPVTLAVAAMAALAVAGCSLSTNSSNAPTAAHIVADGSAPGPLQLIVSTDFSQTQNQNTGNIAIQYNSADSSEISLPYDSTVAISSLGIISVALINPDTVAASVHLTIGLDNGQGFDRTATLASGQALSYTYVYHGPVFP